MFSKVDGVSEQYSVKYNSQCQIKGSGINLLKTGEALLIEGDFDYSNMLKELNAKVVKTESVNQVYSVYAYSPYINVYKLIDGKKVNVHIAKYDNHTKIGWPLIFGSF